MKRICASILLSLALVGVAFAGQHLALGSRDVIAVANNTVQNSDASKKKTPEKTVDCSAVNDAALTASVKEKLANTPSLKDFTINVTVKDGTVTLTGAVKMGRQKGTATLQTRRVVCVKKVDNQLTVDTPPAKSPKSTQ